MAKYFNFFHKSQKEQKKGFDYINELKDFKSSENILIAEEEIAKLSFEQIREIFISKINYFAYQKPDQFLGFVKFFVKNGVEVDQLIYHRESILFIAARAGNIPVMQFLIESGANLNLRDNYGNTALHMASYHNKEAVELLLDAGADTNIENDKYKTPIHSMCTSYGLKSEMIKSFVNRGLSLNLLNSKGQTPIELIVQEIYNLSGDITKTPLHPLKVLQVLLKFNNVYPEIASFSQFTPLQKLKCAYENLKDIDSKSEKIFKREKDLKKIKEVMFELLVVAHENGENITSYHGITDEINFYIDNSKNPKKAIKSARKGEYTPPKVQEQKLKIEPVKEEQIPKKIEIIDQDQIEKQENFLEELSNKLEQNPPATIDLTDFINARKLGISDSKGGFTFNSVGDQIQANYHSDYHLSDSFFEHHKIPKMIGINSKFVIEE